MKRILITIGVLVVLGLLAIPKVKSLTQASDAGQSSNASNEPLLVDVHLVEAQVFENKIFTTGTLLANESVDLRSETSGKITELQLEEGQQVKAGELLLKINDSELQAQLKQAEYRLSLAEQRETRQKQLLDRGGISQDQYDATLNELNVLQSEVDLIKAQIDKTQINAPFDGVVGLRYVSNGSYISPTTEIANLQSINPIKIEFSIPERYAGVVEEGDRVIFSVQGQDQDFEASIYAIEPRIDPQTRTLRMRARAANNDGLLLPGAFANMELILEEIEDALLIPSISVIPELDGQKVFVLRDGVVQEQQVSTGIRTESSVQITSGLAPGDSVLTTGLLQVRSGQPVRVDEVDRFEELDL
ncbi:efflux RND transporter periplasmic adaptor subunit [Gracilimonas mengyeensis]|uniref:Membrane fusion protein, multidrug efflux system n=1 Tax=Gracilimonas mengyeensis TaxID=1302730 RepID=A0A521ACM6_9BACT|nr:efflux RND transporter periplasmic adaptor subunit [Gracilimonas mengyeensis]SMO32552.1 membrane fusion protein, multidrug efflux system [Gracilimonas mengyeensis]